jgi:hypothetical protein
MGFGIQICYNSPIDQEEWTARTRGRGILHLGYTGDVNKSRVWEWAILTFISEGKRSLWVKYERRLVWKAPETTDKATSIAFCRTSTATVWVSAFSIGKNNSQVLPVRIVTSSAATNSVNTASTWSNPAKTFMISELGFAYFFVRTAAKKAVRVYSVSLDRSSQST